MIFMMICSVTPHNDDMRQLTTTTKILKLKKNKFVYEK